MPVQLPRPIAEYFAAKNANDFDALAQCFAGDAVVHDEGHDYRGIDAIRAWAQAAQAKYQYSTDFLGVTSSEGIVNVRARLTGNFPGSPAELEYVFTLANDKIRSLIID